MGRFKVFSKIISSQDKFEDEEKDFHSFVREFIPFILDVTKDDVIILHEYDNVDFVCIDKDGVVYFIECKLERNPEIKRKVISQIVDYALESHNIEYSKLSKAAKGDLVNIFLERKIEDFNSAIFKKTLDENISKKAINIYVVSDFLPDDLINSAINIFVGQRRVPIRLVEIKRFTSNNERTVFIRTINDEGIDTSSPRDIFNTQQFLNYIKDKEKRELFKEIIDRFENKYKDKGYFTFGRGGDVIFKINNHTRAIFILSKNGFIKMSGYDYLKPKLKKEYIEDYYKKFKAELDLKKFKPNIMLDESASTKTIKDDPLIFPKEKFFLLLDELISALGK